MTATIVQRWHGWTPRERAGIALAAVVVLGALLWTLVWQPVARDRSRVEQALEHTRAGLAQARLDAAEIASPAPAPRVQPSLRGAIEATLARTGLRDGASIEVNDRRATIVLPAARFDAVVALLDMLAREHGIRAIEATLTSRVEPGTVRAELTLAAT